MEDQSTETTRQPAHRNPVTVFGRQGSPTVTLALPFSRVDVRADDVAPQVADLAALVARLARAMLPTSPTDEVQRELVAIAAGAEALAGSSRDEVAQSRD
jgi:hypothetical protein